MIVGATNMFINKKKFHLKYTFYFALVLLAFFAVNFGIDTYVMDESLSFKGKRFASYVALALLVTFALKWVKGAKELNNESDN